MSQKLPVNGLERFKNKSQFEKYLIKTVMRMLKKDIFLKPMFEILIITWPSQWYTIFRRKKPIYAITKKIKK